MEYSGYFKDRVILSVSRYNLTSSFLINHLSVSLAALLLWVKSQALHSVGTLRVDLFTLFVVLREYCQLLCLVECWL